MSLSHRPKRVRVVCGIAAGIVLVVFTLIGTLLTSSSDVFHKGDQLAMIGLGVVFAAGILLIARPKVEADADKIVVQNIIGRHELPWQVVRAVKFDRGQPWLSLELEDDDTLSVLAVQAADKEYSLPAVKALRALHAASRQPA